MANNRPNPLEIGVIIVLLLAILAFLIPTMFSAQSSPETITIEQDESQTIILTAGLEASLNTVGDGTDTSINVSIIDSDDGITRKITNLSEGNSSSVTIQGESITVTNEDKLSNTRAIITYEFPIFYSWPSGVSEIVQLLITIIVILFLAVVYLVAQGDYR